MIDFTRQQRLGIHYNILGCQALLCGMPNAASTYLDAKDAILRTPMDEIDLAVLEETAIEAYAILKQVNEFLCHGGDMGAVRRLDEKSFAATSSAPPVSEEQAMHDMVDSWHITGRGGDA